MNIQAIISDIKALVKIETNYREHFPKVQGQAATAKDTPNTGIYRVVVLGTGKMKQAGLNRFAEIAVVVVNPESGGDPNKSNEDAAQQAERLVDVLADYDQDDAQTQEEVDATIGREAGRTIITFSLRVHYKLTEE